MKRINATFMLKHFTHGLEYHTYQFQTSKYQNQWRCIKSNTLQYMKLYYSNQLTMRSVLSTFKQVFGITPIVLREKSHNQYDKYKTLALYILLQYSKEDDSSIARELCADSETMKLFNSYSTNNLIDTNDLKLFFTYYEATYLEHTKKSLMIDELDEL